MDSFGFSFNNFDKAGEYVVYNVKVLGPNSISFHIKDRYSSMRNLSDTLIREARLTESNTLPKFPGKKLFNKSS